MAVFDETRRRALGPVLLVVLVAAVGGGIWWSHQQQAQPALTTQVQEKGLIRGVVGSEKMAFFADPRVQAALGKQGLVVTVDKAGSREIATLPKLKSYDFAFPAGEPAAVKIQQTLGTGKSSVPFYTVMTVATWKPIVRILEANGLVRQDGGFYYILDMRGFLQLAVEGKRWKDLKASDAYAINRSVLISSTDVRTSNSAAMYLSIASYVFNDEAVVENEAQVRDVVPRVAPLFLKQGFQENSSAGPFEDYKLIGMGKAPLVMVYEAQFLEEMIKNEPLANRDQMVLLYPRPTVYAKQQFIPISAAGEKLGAVLESDAELQQLAAEYGWRTKQPQIQATVWKDKAVKAPDNLVDIINPPRYDIVEALIGGVEQISQGNAP
jgi:hypothetical protein